MLIILVTIAVSLLESVPFIVVYAARFIDVNDNKYFCRIAVRFEKFNKFFFYNDLVAVFVNIAEVAIVVSASNGQACK